MKKEELKKSANHNSYLNDKIEIDCVIFNFEQGCLKVMLVKHQDCSGNIGWGLASDKLREGETMSGTARKILKNYIGVDHFFLEQLKAFGYRSLASMREDISIGYYALIKTEQSNAENEKFNSDVLWVSINEIPDLNDKHKVILDFSLKELRKNICSSAIGFNLLPEKFTLLQVMHLYQEVLGIQVNKSNFRRKILQTGLIKGLSEKEEDVPHRAAILYSLNISPKQFFCKRRVNLYF